MRSAILFGLLFIGGCVATAPKVEETKRTISPDQLELIKGCVEGKGTFSLEIQSGTQSTVLVRCTFPVASFS